MSNCFRYVVFTKGDHWICKWLHPLFSHCFTITPYNGKWIVCGKSRKSFDLYTIDNHSDILSDSVVIKVEAKERARGLLMLNTCVGQVKQQLGIRKPFIWTPYQLLRYLNEKPKETKANSRAESAREAAANRTR